MAPRKSFQRAQPSGRSSRGSSALLGAPVQVRCVHGCDLSNPVVSVALNSSDPSAALFALVSVTGAKQSPNPGLQPDLSTSSAVQGGPPPFNAGQRVYRPISAILICSASAGSASMRRSPPTPPLHQIRARLRGRNTTCHHFRKSVATSGKPLLPPAEDASGL